MHMRVPVLVPEPAVISRAPSSLQMTPHQTLVVWLSCGGASSFNLARTVLARDLQNPSVSDTGTTETIICAILDACLREK